MNKKRIIKTMLVAVPIMLFVILSMQTENSAVASQVRDNGIGISFEQDTEDGADAFGTRSIENQCQPSEENMAAESEATEESDIEISAEETGEETAEVDADKAADKSDDVETFEGLDEETAGEDDNNPDAGNIGSSAQSVGSYDMGSYVSEKADNNTGTVGYILIGDSRFVGMDEVVDVDSHANQYIVAKSGAGHDFLVNEALPRAASIEVQHPEVKTWYYIINLGINDLESVWKYVGTYRSLVISKNLVIESVNPIEYTSVAQTNQARIKSFNEKMKLVQGATYLDTYNTLMRNGYSTVDGLHYTEDTSNYIYKCIQKCMREIESKS